MISPSISREESGTLTENVHRNLQIRGKIHVKLALQQAFHGWFRRCCCTPVEDSRRDVIFQMFRGKIRDSVVELFSEMIGSDYCQKRACVLD